MTALSKKKLLNVAYTITADKRYSIMTSDSAVAEELKRLGIDLTFNHHLYSTTVNELPQSNLLNYKQHKPKIISPEKRKEFEAEYQRLLDMRDALEDMQKAVEMQEEFLEKMVKRNGLKLKPNLPNDSEMFSPAKATRLHIKSSVIKDIDQEAVEKLSKKYPALKKCFGKKIVKFFDRQSFEQASKTLPPAALEKVVSYSENLSFNEYELPDYECKNCGAKFTVKGICKHCGASKSEIK